jgi:hypothetical protein
VLVNPAYREAVVNTAKHFAGGSAATAQQVQHMLNQVFAALRLSLAAAIHNGLVVVFIFSVGAFVAALFLKDAPMTEQPRENGAAPEQEEDKAVV